MDLFKELDELYNSFPICEEVTITLGGVVDDNGDVEGGIDKKIYLKRADPEPYIRFRSLFEKGMAENDLELMVGAMSLLCASMVCDEDGKLLDEKNKQFSKRRQEDIQPIFNACIEYENKKKV